MKKIVTILSVITLFVTCVNAQKTDDLLLEYGAKAGVNFSTAKTSGSGSSGSISGTGVLIGGYVAFPITDVIKIQPELLYDHHSGTDNGMTTNLNYLTVPVIAKYAIQSSGFSVLAGPQIGLLLSAKSKENGESISTKEFYNSTNFSLIIGAEYALPVGINFSARYNAGLSNISKVSIDGNSEKLSAFAISIGYRLSK